MLSIRPAGVEDAALLVTLIRELAEFERLTDEVSLSDEDLIRDGFGRQPKFRAVIAEWDGQVAGYALFFPIYSTFKGSAGLLLEDLFVRPPFRGKGIGKGLLAYVAQVAHRDNCYAVRWEVLDWNQKAVDFYRSLGAEFRNEWKAVILTDEALKRLAGKAQ